MGRCLFQLVGTIIILGLIALILSICAASVYRSIKDWIFSSTEYVETRNEDNIDGENAFKVTSNGNGATIKRITIQQDIKQNGCMGILIKEVVTAKGLKGVKLLNTQEFFYANGQRVVARQNTGSSGVSADGYLVNTFSLVPESKEEKIATTSFIPYAKFPPMSGTTKFAIRTTIMMLSDDSYRIQYQTTKPFSISM